MRAKHTTQHTCRSERGAHTLHDGQSTHSSPRHQTKHGGSIEKAHHCDGPLLHEDELGCESLNHIRGVSNVHRSEARQASERRGLCRSGEGVEGPWTRECGEIHRFAWLSRDHVGERHWNHCVQKPCGSNVQSRSRNRGCIERRQAIEPAHREHSDPTARYHQHN